MCKIDLKYDRLQITQNVMSSDFIGRKTKRWQIKFLCPQSLFFFSENFITVGTRVRLFIFSVYYRICSHRQYYSEESNWKRRSKYICCQRHNQYVTTLCAFFSPFFKVAVRQKTMSYIKFVYICLLIKIFCSQQNRNGNLIVI